MSGMGDMKFTTAGDMMIDLPTRLESWAQNEELVASGVMTEHGHDCIDAAQRLRAMRAESEKLAASNHAYLSNYQEAGGEIERLRAIRAALRDMAKYVWRGDWDKLEPETRALLGEKE